MSSANGTFVDCGYGQGYQLTILCQGPACYQYQSFPSLKCENKTTGADQTLSCTNNVVCESSNLTSTFVVSMPAGSNVSVTQQLNIFGHGVLLNVAPNGTVSYTNDTTSPTATPTSTPSAPGSSSSSKNSSTPLASIRPKIKTLVALMVFSLVFLPVSLATCIPGLSQIGQDFPPGFSELLGQFSEKTCELGADKIIEAASKANVVTWQAVADLTVECLEGLGVAELAVPALGVAVNPILGFTVVPVSVWICEKIAQTLLFGALQNLGDWSCEAVASALASGVDCTDTASSTPLPSTPTPPTATPTPTKPASSASSTTSAAGSSYTGTLVGLTDPCIVCGINTLVMESYFHGQQCGKTPSSIAAWELRLYYCDSDLKPTYSAECQFVCANPCTIYTFQELEAAVGPNNWFPTDSTQLGEICNQCPNMAADGGAACPQGGGQSCICGVGEFICGPCL
jgi:hypothetical protein